MFKDKLNFGKYKGRTIQSVYEEDATYIDWCLENIFWFEMNDKDVTKIKEKASKDMHEYYNDMIGAIDPDDLCF